VVGYKPASGQVAGYRKDGIRYINWLDCFGSASLMEQLAIRLSPQAGKSLVIAKTTTGGGWIAASPAEDDKPFLLLLQSEQKRKQ